MHQADDEGCTCCLFPNSSLPIKAPSALHSAAHCLITDFKMSSLIATALLFLFLLLNIGLVEPKKEECCKEKRVGSVFYSLLPDHHHSYSRELFSFFFLFSPPFTLCCSTTINLQRTSGSFPIFHFNCFLFSSSTPCCQTTINFSLTSGSFPILHFSLYTLLPHYDH